MQLNAGSVPPSIPDIARHLIGKGWAVIPIPFKSKNPAIRGWPDLRITDVMVDEHFNGDQQNIGVLLGVPSNGLIDIDIDCVEACEIAPVFFPKTLTFGRISKPKSHLFFSCADATTKKYLHNGMLLEIRSTKSQTVLPGSTHPEGELVEGDLNEEVTPISVDDLINAAGRTAAAALLAQKWQTMQGTRHFTALSLAGALLHSDWEADEVRTFIKAVVTSGRDESADE